MRLSVSILAALAAAVNSFAIPPSLNYTTYDNQTLSPSATYDCRGSIMCSTVKVVWCDEGVNRKLIRNDDINYGAAGSGKPHVGICHGKGTDFGCAVFIQGNTGCVRSGNDMWWDYQEIRKNHCHHCGHKYWGNGCMTTIDYEPECDRIS
ncbi:hypothetical protein F4804DRAFT_350912 [Jackrogersella minutella]|nr:hypothetical protein F4804DRAFT_350912 [Jackrogersella minutella]